MSNLRILAANLHDTATLTATSEAMPVAYTQRSERSYVWRSIDLEQQVIEGVLPIGGFVDCLAFDRTNLGGTGTVQIELFSGANSVYDSGQVSTALLIPVGVWRPGIDSWGATYNDQMPGGSTLGVHWLPEPKAIDRYQLTFNSTGPDSWIEIGRIFVGLSFSPDVNMNWSPAVDWLESVEQRQTEGGSLRSIGGGEPRRKVSVQLDWLSESDRQRLVTQLVKVGLSADLLVSLYPGQGGLRELEHTMVCRRENSFSHKHSRLNNWQTSLSFLEV